MEQMMRWCTLRLRNMAMRSNLSSCITSLLQVVPFLLGMMWLLEGMRAGGWIGEANASSYAASGSALAGVLIVALLAAVGTSLAMVNITASLLMALYVRPALLQATQPLGPAAQLCLPWAVVVGSAAAACLSPMASLGGIR